MLAGEPILITSIGQVITMRAIEFASAAPQLPLRLQIS
jgi:hypothetical protein